MTFNKENPYTPVYVIGPYVLMLRIIIQMKNLGIKREIGEDIVSISFS